MSYNRVIPRDLFNEASLLKCLGRLSLLILDGLAPNSLRVDLNHSDKGFKIKQNSEDGSIYAVNVTLKRNGQGYYLSRGLNSRESWPLEVVLSDHEVTVFDSEGNLTEEFLEWANP